MRCPEESKSRRTESSYRTCFIPWKACDVDIVVRLLNVQVVDVRLVYGTSIDNVCGE